MTLQKVLDVLNENTDIYLFTEDDNYNPAAIYDGRNSIDIRYNSRKVSFIIWGANRTEIGVYGPRL